MFTTSKIIKLSFARPKFETNTNTNEITCTLTATLRVPSVQTNAKDVPNATNNAEIIAFPLVISSKGVAKCKAGDKFDKTIGRHIAQARAESAAYKTAQKVVSDVAMFYGECAAEFSAKSDAVVAHNKLFAAEVGDSARQSETA